MQRKRGNCPVLQSPTGSVASFPPGTPLWAAASPQKSSSSSKSAALAKQWFFPSQNPLEHPISLLSLAPQTPLSSRLDPHSELFWFLFVLEINSKSIFPPPALTSTSFPCSVTLRSITAASFLAKHPILGGFFCPSHPSCSILHSHPGGVNLLYKFGGIFTLNTAF